MPARIVVIGDLNGASAALEAILAGTRLIDRRGRWTGGDTRLVQVGDLFNRGGGAREALELLLALGRQARRAGGAVHVLAGNHEVMTALRNESYCTEAEYLSFATVAQRRAWPGRVERAMRRLYRVASGPILPLEPRLEAWKIDHVPGRAALRRELGPNGRLGRAIRRLPVALILDDVVLSHSAITPGWARLGVSGLNRKAALLWREARLYTDLPRTSLFRDPDGPLWNRSLLLDTGRSVERAVRRSLELLGARRMVVGHTQTELVPDGERGHIAMRCDARLVAVDVGMTSAEGSPCAALLIDGNVGREWTPDRTRLLWRDGR